VRVGLKKPDLLSIIGGYDGLAVRSATKADKDVIAAAKNLKVIGRAGIGVDQHRHSHRPPLAASWS